MVAGNEGVGFIIWNARLLFEYGLDFCRLVELGLMDRLFAYGGRKLLEPKTK